MSPGDALHPTAAQLAAHARGELSADESRDIEQHLQTCADCQTTVDATFAKDTPNDGLAIRPRPAPTIGGKAFGRYRLLALVGKGGMGAVYKAHDTQLERLVALKIPKIDPNNTEALARFYQEARTAATLSHPNLCPVYDVGEQDGRHFLTMLYIPGQTLADLIDEAASAGRPFPQRHAALLVRKLARALDYAHAHGVVHRDLKPANVMIKREGALSEPLITDFGLARRADQGNERLTQSLHLMGTPAYMSPEQASGRARDTGAPGDVYSLGVIAYELFTGKLPFDFAGLALPQMLRVIADDELAPPSVHRPDLDPALEAICLKALAKKPEDRFASMKEFASALTAYLEAPRPKESLKQSISGGNAAGIVAELASERPPSANDPPLAVRWRLPPWAGWTVAAAVLVAVTVAAVFVATNEGQVRIELVGVDTPVELKLDGVLVNQSSLESPLRLRPGPHELTAAGDAYEPLTLPFTVARGKYETLPVALKPRVDRDEAAAAPPARRNDYDAIATGKWIPVLRLPKDVPDDCGFQFQEGVLVGREVGGNFVNVGDFHATDAIMRAKVMKITGQNLSMGLRRSEKTPYVDEQVGAWFNGGDWFGQAERKKGDRNEISNFHTAADYNGFFELAVSVKGDQLTIYANGQALNTVTVSVVRDGFAGIAASGKSLFKDVEVMRLDSP